MRQKIPPLKYKSPPSVIPGRVWGSNVRRVFVHFILILSSGSVVFSFLVPLQSEHQLQSASMGRLLYGDGRPHYELVNAEYCCVLLKIILFLFSHFCLWCMAGPRADPRATHAAGKVRVQVTDGGESNHVFVACFPLNAGHRRVWRGLSFTLLCFMYAL